MPLKALLLSKDAEVVQSLRRLLSDQDIATEHCVEPFSAAKKLLDQHFDAIIVDCEDVQGAGWVVQSARMAALNKTSIIIAIQGMAAAGGSKLGENFTLQRPLVAKQAETTLKTARGMMKPGAGAAAPSTPASSMSPAITSEVPHAAATISTGPQSQENSGADALGELDLDELITPKAPPTFAGPARRESVSASPAFGAGAAAAPARERNPLSSLEPETREALADAALEKLSTLAVTAPPPPRPAPPEPPAVHSVRSSTSSPEGKLADLVVPVGGSLTPSPGQHPSSVFDSARRLASESQAKSHFGEAEAIRQRFAGPSYRRRGSHAGIIALAVAVLALVGSIAWTRFHHPSSAEGEGLHVRPLIPVIRATQPEVVPQHNQELVDQPDPNVVETPDRAPQPARGNDNAAKPSAAIVGKEIPESPRPGVPEAATPVNTPVTTPAKATPHGEPIEAPAASTTAAEVEPPPLPVNLPPANGSAGHAINNLLSSVAIPAPPAAVPPQRIQVSQGIVEGMLVHTVKPIYPALARNAHVEGQVVLKAVIAKDGSIRDLKVLKGPAMLTRSAMTAVKQWRYKPYLLNAQPVEVETQITLDFRL